MYYGVHADNLITGRHPLSPQNIILKYADDTYLLVPSSNRRTVPSELNHISAWAINNNLKLNVNKSRELIIHGRARFDPPPHPWGLSCRGPSRPRLCPERRPQCWSPSYRDSRSLYAVRILKAHGLPASSLHEVTRATVLARLLYMYAAPAWRGFATAQD